MITEAQVKEMITGEDFNHCIRSISEISLDNGNPSVRVPMVVHPARFHDYDLITGTLYKYKPKSPDMVLFIKDTIVFIEFKSGKVKADEIKVKAIEGCFIILNKIIATYKSGVEFIDVFRLRKVFILVHKPEKNSRTRLSDHLDNTRNRYGLEPYKGTFFHDVQTLNKDKFIDWLKKEQLIQENPADAAT